MLQRVEGSRRREFEARPQRWRPALLLASCDMLRAMGEVTHRTLEANGIEVHCVEQGRGPLVVLCHGFPESWYSWRHQLGALAEAGYRAVALDMRGYGATSKPDAIDAYALSYVIGDVVGAIAALGETRAVLVGHDWSAPVVWYATLMRPDVVRAAAVLSVPYAPPFVLPPGITLTQVMSATAGDREYYRRYFQQPGIAEAEFEENVRDSLLRFMYVLSGDIQTDGVRDEPFDGHFPKGQRLLDSCPLPARLPAWLSAADVDFYAEQFSRSGFQGALNWYRNIDVIPAMLSPFVGAALQPPTLYLYGDRDMIAGNHSEALTRMQEALPNHHATVQLEGAGHWLQQERPERVNRELIAFLNQL